MTEYKTKTGRILTDADFEALADEAEKGYDLEKILASRCSTCKGTGIDPKAHSKKRNNPRISNSHDELPPCTACGGTGEPQA